MESENKNTGIKIITGILAVLLVVAGAFAIKLYNQEKNTKAELTEEKELVLNDLKQMVTKYDAVIEENNLKDTELNQARDRIQVLIDSVQKMEANISVLRRYRDEVYKLKKEREYLFAQNDSLKGMNKMLAMRVDSTTYELEVSKMKRDSLAMVKEELAEKVALGSSLAANKLVGTGVIVRNSGKLVENDNARRVDRIRACYTVPQNRIAEAGDKQLYVQVLDPQNNILGENKTVTIDSVTSITYSAISKFYYEKTALDICENVAPRGDKFAEGLYKINIFDGGKMIASTSLVLD
ncbi:MULTISPECIES: hypothetical protein [Leeuwenhoekiella]|jgi:regulator of replication initiation timing|uniref:Uncharacterized protein n=1 Tax=Leeuwenhoekiella blandensis (strain CECT 7118 / CCUG 51940 / KCTC 22103 / MED217) TaxID=398720 RepID=A3XGP8_LEEBM|nr:MULTISPECIES: hypothetical protein [Leeuwenhoekiella]EAQ50702.1 hypothetical protein MED217_14205 [Leeuwenhoekiella blandensis MED217]MAO44719.1 hypothetical protein [Leeuwenhoekiella sp.]HBT08929.1 hypothetical protein [Leeuwenhoekiella sp.]|tara:strand:- start:1795 stop:2679 length:885 start_codon:yes stop_codon:yes gene_type:complete